MPNQPTHSAASFAFSRRMEAILADSDVRFVVIGASGWFGLATLDMLDSVLGPAMTDRVIAFGSHARDIAWRPGRSIRVQPLESLDDLPSGKRYVFLHYAFLTRDKVGTKSLEDYVACNRAITDAVARAIPRRETIGLFVPSSGAVYRRDGVLDDDMAKNPYGVLKLQDEARFAELAAAQGIPLVTIRVFNLSGPFINKLDSYVLSTIILDVLHARPVLLRARHPVIRSYVSVFDVVDLALCALADRTVPPGRPFDTAGDREIEIGELVRLCTELLGRRNIPIERPPMRLDCPDRYVGDGAAMHALAARYGLALLPLNDQIRATAQFLRDRLDISAS